MRTNLIIILFICGALPVRAQHKLTLLYSGKDSSFEKSGLKLQENFVSYAACMSYVNNMAQLFWSRGYPAFSIDNIVQRDKETVLTLFTGRRYYWAYLRTDSIDERALNQTGFQRRMFESKPVNFQQLQTLQEGLIRYYENNGYPFAQTSLEQIQLDADSLRAHLKLKSGPAYKIDSIRLYGNLRIRQKFITRYFDITRGSLYNKQKIDLAAQRIAQSDFMQETQVPDLTMLGTGAVLNLYLAPRKTNTINFLLGFLPEDNQTGKLRITGDVNLVLKNALASAETILFSFQALQPKSPRLNFGYQQPYFLGSPFGINTQFDLFKKDSTFLNISAQIGTQYSNNLNRTARLYLLWQRIFLLANGVDTNLVKATRRLPINIDVNSTNMGGEFEWNKLNYRFNPTKGPEIKIAALAGIKKIIRNNDVLSIFDPGFNYASLYDSIKTNSYQLRIRLQGAYYFPAGKKATLKTALQTGIYESPTIFRNELFQIGGNRLLRGFDEESIYATRYAVGTVEYRLITGLNSYLFGFSDIGWVQNRYQEVNLTNRFISGGIGLLFDTKKGILNLTYALGKRDDIPFSLRNASKIHIGYVNYF